MEKRTDTQEIVQKIITLAEQLKKANPLQSACIAAEVEKLVKDLET